MKGFVAAGATKASVDVAARAVRRSVSLCIFVQLMIIIEQRRIMTLSNKWLAGLLWIGVEKVCMHGRHGAS